MEGVAELREWVAGIARSGGCAAVHRRVGQDDGVLFVALPAWVRNEMKTVETEIKYAGYLEQQKK